CMMARAAGVGVVLRLSSGSLADEVRSSAVRAAWLRAMLESAHVVCSQGPFWTSFFEGFLNSRDKIREIPNATVVRPRRSPPRQRAQHVVFVGWMMRSKGIFEALDAFERLSPDIPGLRMTMAGGGQDIEEFRAEVTRRGLGNRIAVLG